MALTSPFPRGIAFAERTQGAGGSPPLAPGEAEALGPATAPRRHVQFALGRACAREALRQLGAGGDIAIGRAADRRPLWPEGYVGSITHSHEHAAAAAASVNRYRGLGIDLERTRAPSDGLLERICRPEERAAIAALDDALRAIAFTAMFAAKESVYKAVNPLTGVYLGFHDARVAFAGDPWDGTGGAFTFTLLKDSGPDFPVGHAGQGAWRLEGAWVLAGVWLPVP